ncbi:MAG: hypothetical protein ACSLE1_12555 [Sphingobium sp.]
MTSRHAPARAAFTALTALLSTSAANAADPAPFDLPGPNLSINVTRGDKSLPIGRVPALAAGDVLEIEADLPADQSVKYLLVSAFLRGATNPPPKKWIASAQTWKRKDKDRVLKLTVPADAQQMVLFMVQDTGGDFSTISDVVRGKPGEFVRVTQNLSQASLDRARLNAFVAGIRAQENTHPEYLRSVAPALSSSLAVKLNADCLAKLVEAQAACLLENREALVLGDVHSNSLTETIIGTPADLAFQISATREAGYGMYSPYIGVVRDVARIFGAFNNPEFSYLPALGIQSGATMSLLLNAAPSFRKPKSVLVAGMPAIEKDVPPPLRATGEGAVCAAQPGATLKVEGAPLIYATEYAHDMTLALTTKDGRAQTVPVTPRADKGGYVLASRLNAADFEPSTTGRLQGAWGFDAFVGPEFLVQFPQDAPWHIDEVSQRLIVGRDNELRLKGVAPACVESVTMEVAGRQSQPVKWQVSGTDGITVTVPLSNAKAGDIQFAIKPFGTPRVSTVTARAYAEASRIDNLQLHAGDEAAMLTGLRLDQIKSVMLDDIAFSPEELSRDGDVDKLQLVSDTSDKTKLLAQGHSGKAQVTLKDGRVIGLPVTVAAPRPAVSIIARSIDHKGPVPPISIRVTGQDILPDAARLTVSLSAAEGMQFSARDTLDIAASDNNAAVRLTSANGLRLESPKIAIAEFDPATLGPSIFGPLRFRMVQGGVAGKWQSLATLVRMPALKSISCKPGAATCSLTGNNLFLIDSVADSSAFDRSVSVPNGFIGNAIDVPTPKGATLYMKLRDAPGTIQQIILPAG